VSTRNGRNGDQPDFSILGDFSDGDLLAVVDDLADENGWTNTYAIRQQLGERPPEKLHNIGGRLAWMRRYGWLEKGDREKVESWHERGWEWTTPWRLTAMGQALIDNPTLGKNMESLLSRLTPAKRLALTRELGEAGNGTAPEIRAAIRRQWQRSMHLR